MSSSLLVTVGSLLLLHALITAVQHHSTHSDNHPLIVAEALLGFVLATFAYIHKAGKFEKIDKKNAAQVSLEERFHNPEFMTFNHRGQPKRQ